ncbi:MAG: IPT/TIG domain-containing protein [Bacteroidales bacterium]|nr:IPT/TIG domain-containing protein [Bacteroidales bacterium]
MKNIFKFFGAFLAFVFTFAMTGCVEETLESADVGLHVKVFFPTKVMAGQPMTINGSGFSDVTEIVFPGDVKVTDFEIVSNEMIRVKAPSGISAEGGHIVVLTEDGEAESPLPLTLGNTVITGCSTPAEGEAIEGGTQMYIYGSDLEFITGIEMMDEDGNPVYIDSETFIRKGTDFIIFTVPRKVYEGEVEIKLYSIDGNEVNNDDLPILTYKPASDGGHFETVEHIMWENPDPAGLGAVSWSGQYRFGLEGKDGNSECVATFPADQWEIIKNGTFCLTYEAPEAYQIRATTGWWSFDGDGAYDIHENDERVVDNGDGTYTLVYTLSEEPLKSGIYDLIDDQHLLFTGSGFTPLKIFYTEEVWVGGQIEIVKNVFWKNEDPAGNGEISWNGTYRFGLDGNDGNNECIATFPQETWDIIKNGTFYMSFQATAAQLRITDGWWSTTWTGNDIMAGDERIIDNGDGTFYIEINFAGDPLLDVLDKQHLLFTGSGYTPLELYTQEEVLVGGDQPKEVVLWEGEAIADDWGNQPTILSDAGLELVDAGAKAGQTIYFYFEPLEDAWQVKIVEGHWGPTYAAICSEGNDNNGEFTVYDLAGNDGKYGLELTQEILDAALTQQWWGGAFLLNGDNIKCTKVTLQ